jgi:nicotinamide phosphoribosyltransferase
MQNLMNSILFNTDSYKTGMFLQTPPGTKYVHSYIEARGDSDTLFFGLQSFIKNYLTKPITKEEVEIAYKYWTAHGVPFNYGGWMYIVEKLGGKLPISIKAPQEGLVIPSKNVLVTVVNTDPECSHLTTWVEGALLRGVWYPTTVASNSKKIKNLLKSYLLKSGDVSTLTYKLHDFGH